jgi:hypothetical protein
MTFGGDATGFVPLERRHFFMPNSQSSDADDASKANIIDNKLIPQGNQRVPSKRLRVPEHFLVEQARITDLMCVILTVSLIVASTVAFCYTRSLFSFGFLTLISLPLSIRRRKEEAIFPIGAEDLQIRLKELDVEIEKIKSQNVWKNLPLFNWLKGIFRR